MMNEHQLLVGWHRGVITPGEPVPMDGMGHNMDRMATYAVVDDLMASITVFADKTGLRNAVLFCCMDWLFIQKSVAEAAAGVISSATGIPRDRIFFCCSHTHCGPDTDNPHRAIGRYLAWLYTVLPRYARAAVADLQPATVQIGSAKTEKLNFVRRYILQTPRGIVSESSVRGDFAQGTILDHETPIDNQVQAVRIRRGQGKDILLLNFQVHPGFNGSSKFGNISADIVAGIRYALESAHPDMVCAFFQGGAGNASRASKLEKRPELDREQYGAALVNGALVAVEKGKTVETDTPRVVHRVYDPNKLDRYKPTYKGARPVLELNAVSVGGLSFVTAPYEMFCNSGMDIKDYGKGLFDMTFVCSCTNGENKYIPVRRSFDLDPEMRSFEVRKCRFIAGTAEDLVENYKEMLTELKN